MSPRRWEPVRLVLNLSDVHRNVNFTSDRVYFFNGTAFDFYSSDELEKQSGPANRWRIFPLPNDSALINATPWKPRSQQKSTPMLLPSTTPTGLPFVDYVFIATRPNLTDRQDNLRHILSRHAITNYEWRQKWVRDTCYAPQYREEVVRKLNLWPKHTSESIISRISFASSPRPLFQSRRNSNGNVQSPWNISTFGLTSSIETHLWRSFWKTMPSLCHFSERNSSEPFEPPFEPVP